MSMTKTRRGLILLAWLATVSFIALEATGETKKAKVKKILVINSDDSEHYIVIDKARTRCLSERGFVEGKNLRIDRRALGNSVTKGELLLKELDPDDYDVVCLNGSVPTLAAKQTLFCHPGFKFVFTHVDDPVTLGVVSAMDCHPIANFTGVISRVPVKVRMEFLRKIMPKATRIGVIHVNLSQSKDFLNSLEELTVTNSQFRGMEIIERQVPLISGPGGNQLMAAFVRKNVMEISDVVDVFLSPDDMLGAQSFYAKAIYGNGDKPLIGIGKNDVLAGWGATASICPSLEAVGEQSGQMAAEILNGVPVKNIQPEIPKEYEIAIDIDKAIKLGVPIPIEVIESAKENIICE